MSKFTLVLDPGHGGTDPGAIGNGLQEKNLTLELCQLAKAYIDKVYPTINCLLTRTTDTTMALSARTAFARNAKADALISVHVNSAANASANGFETFIHNNRDTGSSSGKLQAALHRPIARLWTGKNRNDRGQKRANFHMVREFAGPSVLTEHGFIVNKPDSDLLKDRAFMQANAEAIADGAAAFLGVTKSVTQAQDQAEVRAPGILYRVIVEDKQTGAYTSHDNILINVASALKSGSNAILIQKVR